MKALFIGGTGKISSAVSELAIAKGINLYHLNRGKSHRKIEGVKTLQADITNKEATRQALKDHTFDVVVNWINFVPKEIERDIDLFQGKTKQYIFISSASAYQKPISKLPITEDTPLENPYWQYSRDKAACEALLLKAYNTSRFPVTIVRPSHTYDCTLIPSDWGYTVLDRIKNGKKIIIHGDGTSLWVLTHHADFAVGFVGLMGKEKSLGQAYHITSDELLNWNQIYQLFANELGVELNSVHIPSDFIAQFDARMEGSLLGDKAHSVLFDNSKIKGLVPQFDCKIPFSQGVKEIVEWYETHPEWRVVDKETDATIEKIIASYER